MTAFAHAGKVLVAGFAPFGPAVVNSSSVVASLLKDATIHGAPVRPLTLPVSFTRAPQLLLDTVRELDPVMVFLLAQSSDCPAVLVERSATNFIDAPMPDVDGLRPQVLPVLEGGPFRLNSSLPVDDMAAAMRSTGLPAFVSASAGSFVGNAVFYQLLHALAGTDVPAAFLRVPPLPAPSMHPYLPSLVYGVRAAMTTAAGDMLARTSM